jgi:membrane-associated phospholipid phosphatase
MYRPGKTLTLFMACGLFMPLPAQVGSADNQPPAPYQRPISLGKLVPNIVDDQGKIWLFPTRLKRKRNWIPVVAILGTTAALIAADSRDAGYFRSTSTFSGFNKTFSGNATAIGTVVAPVSLYAAGLFSKDAKMQGTAMLAGEAVADAEILSFVLKDSFNRARPSSLQPGANFSDTWFDGKGSFLRSRGGMPSGHAIAAFSVATVVARRYPNHRWVMPVSYGLAGLVAFSRVSTSAHFVSDVFVGAALGYSVSRFAVLRQ